MFGFFFASIFGIISFIISLVIYFLPTTIAIARKRRNTGAIFLLNLLLGWTFIGWVVALVWAVKK
ncbi:superinfection immunity protein [Dehalogenimonas sp. THU2]|uniref:superinfection immunity protein n=1 Tax=Dehalogenimonas sp. THU2 TaxID=3151121 RepID=UPI0032189E70